MSPSQRKDKNVKKKTIYVRAEMFDDGGDSEIELKVNGRIVSIPVRPDVKAYFNEQFKSNTPNQQKRRTTMMNILRNAYEKGLQDAKQ